MTTISLSIDVVESCEGSYHGECSEWIVLMEGTIGHHRKADYQKNVYCDNLHYNYYSSSLLQIGQYGTS